MKDQLECEHEEIDYDDYNLPMCMDCGAFGEDVVSYPEYDKYEDYRRNNEGL